MSREVQLLKLYARRDALTAKGFHNTKLIAKVNRKIRALEAA